MSKEFQYTTAIRKIRAMKSRIKIIQGGSSAGKTYGILPVLIDMAAKNPGLSISIVSESMPHLRKGVMRDFINIMKSTNRFIKEHWNITNSIYTFANDSYIEFFSADNDSKLRGARRNVLYVNEANNISFESYNQLAMRTDKDIFIDFNPVAMFWAHREVEPQRDAEKIVLTYKDNEALSKTVIDFLEDKIKQAATSSYWKNWVNVYVYGQIGSLEGVIFNNWKTISSIPEQAKLLGYGLDFGFTNDPTALIAVYKFNDNIILDEIIYQKNLLNSDISSLMKKNNVSGLIYADSAEPKSIAELKRYGHTVLATTKGRDSITFGINILQEYDILITDRSKNLIDEFSRYTWIKNKDGSQENVPIDDFNHCFVGNTKITTINGDVDMIDIKPGDLVLTSQGYKPVLKKFNNGKKKVNKYSLLFDTFEVHLECTDNHKIKTDKGWKEIKELKKEDVLYLHKNLMGKHITYIQEKGITQKAVEECTEMCGNIIMEKYQRDTTYITSMELQQITELKTSISSKKNFISDMKEKRDSRIIQSGQNHFGNLELNQQRNGTQVKKEDSGTNNTQLSKDLVSQIWMIENANNVDMNLNQNHTIQNFVQTNANQHIEENLELIMNKESVNVVENILQQTNIQKHKLVAINVLESYEEEIYDFMVDDCHEYFANGVLVHNCIDAVRYFAMMKLKKTGSIRIIR